MEKILTLRISKELWDSFYKVHGKNSHAIVRSLILGYLVFEINKKGERKE
jgi:hypothetical protein